MKRYNIRGNFANQKGSVDLEVPVISFKEDNAHIIFCPALDISGYGATLSEANDSFATVVSEFLNYTTNKGTLWTDLRKLGWTVRKKKQNFLATPPQMSELLETNPEFNRVFNNLPYKKFNTGLTLPAYA